MLQLYTGPPSENNAPREGLDSGNVIRIKISNLNLIFIYKILHIFFYFLSIF